MFLETGYASTHLLAFMNSEWNIRAIGTCKANQIGFDSEAMKLENKVERGSFIQLVGKWLGMVTCRWKDSKVFQSGIS